MPLRILLLLAMPLAAADRTHTVVPEDYFSLATITEVAVSPDGKQVAFAEARWSKDDDARKGDLWVIATDGKTKPVRLTFDRANDRNIKWTADGRLYFLGNRKRSAETKAPYDGKTQIWTIPAAGGEPRAITKETGGVDHYDLAIKDGSLFYSIESTTADSDDFAVLRSKYRLDYGHGVRKVSEIHRIDLESWRSTRVYDGKRYVREFAVTQDGKKLALVTAFDDSVVKSEGESRVDIATADETRPSGSVWTVTTPPTDVYRRSAASPNAWLENLAWNANGTEFLFNAIFDGYPASLISGHLSNSVWKCAAMPLPQSMSITGYGRASGTGINFLANDDILFLIEQHGVNMLFGMRHQSDSSTGDTFKYRDKDKQTIHIYGYSAGATDDDVCFISSASDTISKLTFLKHPDSQVGVINSSINTWKLPTIKHITWKAPDGSSVGGVLELPPGHDGKSKLPLVVAIHGGPTTSSKAALEFDPHNGRMYFSTAGYAVLCPNYRGSTGYGDKFVTDLIGRENDIEVNDIIAGVQHLVKEGIADPERVGVMGWSNGGYLTNCLITRKDLPFKLKAASSGAGIVDTVAEWGFNDEPAYPKVFKKGHPWETPEIYKKTSPTYDLGNIKTPTIIHVGGNDVRCPPGHSRMLYRAMKEYLNVPCELCEYPGEPHGLGKMTHRRAKMEWDLAWFDKYLKKN